MPGWDPVELEGPEWLDGEKARDDPDAGQERGLRGGGQHLFGQKFDREAENVPQLGKSNKYCGSF